jgi:hypothetical protein
MVTTFLFLLLVGSGPAYDGSQQEAQPVVSIDYDTFCAMTDPDAKRTAFVAATAETKAMLARTQVERFMAANKARLTPLQNDYLLELLKYLTPDSYSGLPRSADRETLLKNLESRMMQLFTREDAMALQPAGPCQPKVIK